MLDTQIQQISSDDLDKLFEGEQVLPTADELILGKEQTEDINIPILDDSLLEDEPEVEEVKEEKTETKEEEEVVEETKEEKKDEKEVEEVNTDSINEVLKNTVEYLIDNNLWADFEGRTDLEVTQEVYADLAKKQSEHKALQMFEELVDETGDYGKAIISHIKNGGNPDEVIDIFKEQKQLDNIDTSTEEGKQAKIEQYYSDVLGWKAERVKKFVNRLVEDNDIDAEFESVEESYKEHYKQKLAEQQSKADEANKQKLAEQQQFITGIKNALNDDETLTEKEKQLISSSILDFKHKLNNGQKVNDFYLKFAEIQSNPKEYIEFVQYVMDKQAYKEKLKKIESSTVAKEQFNFIKGNAAISKAKSAQPEQNKDKTDKYKGTNFSFAIKNK